MQDPTKAEMIKALEATFGTELDEFDREEAIYWFANDWHGGQWSNLYSVLSASPYHPGPISNGPEPGTMAEMAYQELEAEFDKS